MAFGMTWKLGATALAVLMGTPLLAAPSVAGDDSAPTNSALGALSFLGGLRIDGRLDSLYDSNMLRRGNGFPAGEDKSDFRITPSVTVAYGLPIGRQQLTVSGNFGRDFFLRNSDLSRNRYGIDAGLNWRVGARCSGLVDVGFLSRQQVFSEVSAVTVNAQETLNAGVSAFCQTATGIGFGVSGRHSEVRNSNSNRVALDVDSDAITPQVTYGSPSLGQFSFSGTFNKARYPNRNVLTADFALQPDEVKILSGRAGYQRGLGGRLSVNAGLSYFEVKPEPQLAVVQIEPGVFVGVDREPTSNLGFDLGLNYASGNRLSGSLVARRQGTASINVGATYQVVSTLAGDIDYRLNRAISLNLSASYDQRDYRNSFATIEEPLPRVQDKFTRIAGSISYSPVDLYSVSFELSHQKRDSDPVEYSYNATAAVLRLRVGFGGN